MEHFKPPAPVGCGDPSPLLRHLAGGLAAATAALWPAPHADFLAAPAARRHLAWLALALDQTVDPAAVLALPLAKAIEAQFVRAPAGLRRALGRLGERAWEADDYRKLWRQLHRPTAAKVLRHLEAIAPAHLGLLALLPKPLHRIQLVSSLSLDDTLVVYFALAAIARRDGGQAADLAAKRWAGARDREGLNAQIADDLTPEPADPGLAATGALQWLGTKALMRDAGRRHRNCLADFVVEAAEGRYAFFEWFRGPGAIVRLEKDPVFGWSLVDARGPENTPVPGALRDELTRALRRMGVHVGVRVAELRAALEWERLDVDEARLYGGPAEVGA